jgi:hypothetical protein
MTGLKVIRVDVRVRDIVLGEQPRRPGSTDDPEIHTIGDSR